MSFSTTCPSCGEKRALRRVVYGLPPAGDLEQRRNVIFGGCARGDDDPPYGCSTCGAGVWWHGVFAAGDDSRHLRLGNLEWMVYPDRGMAVADRDGGGLLLGPDDGETLGLVLALELFGEGESLVGWLQQHHLMFVGGAVGTLGRFAFAADGFRAAGPGGEVLVPNTARLLLTMLRGVLGDGPFDLADAVAWLEERALIPAVLAPD